ncbi:cytosolic Fe-S cluster assembly factor NARFL-like protein [Phycomyces nitens]|nr:cytosolic Fe-S cluster assembly factor NARFL-like protein [Phycomyces nitens]
MAFSSALVLTDLNDYIAPSQACIKPVEIQKTADPGQHSEIKVDDQGSYYEITQDGGESKLEKAAISLNDCLACSGCVTSAESVLISMQSQEELYGVIQANKLALEQNTPEMHRTIVVSLSPQSRASLAAHYNLSPLQVHKKLTYFFKQLGCHHLVDISFARDLSLVESAREFVERYKSATANGSDPILANVAAPGAPRRRGPGVSKQPASQDLPMLASSCPGWVCYAEKTHGEVLPHISATKSPQQMMGTLVKDYLATKVNSRPNMIYHVAVMPCYDKKLEASRPDFFLQEFDTREVDCVLTTGEVQKMFGEQNVDFNQLPEAPLDTIFTKALCNPSETLYGSPGSSSGGQMEYILATAARELFGIQLPSDPSESDQVVVRIGKNADVREYSLETADGQVLLKFATAYGFRNIQNIVRKIKTNKCQYHYVEVMACPGGCANGGGQLSPPETVNAKDWVNHVESIYRSVEGVLPEQNEAIIDIYNEWIGPSAERRQLLRTNYHAVTQNLVNPLATKW